MTETIIPWYEKPVKVNSLERSLQGVVANGDTRNEWGRLPERLYWSSIEDQREDIAELWVVLKVIEYEKAVDAFNTEIMKAYPPSSVGEVPF